MNKKTILKQIQLILDDNVYSKYHQITAMANISALLFEEMKDINWIGFYLVENTELVLGPFQGKIACSKIKIGNGVCGTCALKKETINVPNVHNFQGHIACDQQSNSELVVPIFNGDSLFGLIDIDSPKFDRFSKSDEDFFENISKNISKFFFERKRIQYIL